MSVNPWMIHINNFRLENPSMLYKQVLIEARKTYIPIKKTKTKTTTNKLEENIEEEKLSKKVLDKIHKEIDDDFNNLSIIENKPVKKSNRKVKNLIEKEQQ